MECQKGFERCSFGLGLKHSFGPRLCQERANPTAKDPYRSTCLTHDMLSHSIHVWYINLYLPENQGR